MGYPYHDLIPPALLYLHPGVTRERFVELLADTHYYPYTEFEAADPWDIVKPEFERQEVGDGLEGLAGRLSLSFTPAFKDFSHSHRDEHGIELHAPYCYPSESEQYWHVVAHKKNELGELREEKGLSWGPLQKGDVWYGCMSGHAEGLVERILKEKKFGGNREDDGPQYDYSMIIRRISPVVQSFSYPGLLELYDEWPLFDPEKKFNWSQEQGRFSIFNLHGGFFWQQKNGRYTLDPVTFDSIPAGFEVLNFGYTDLLLTAEAIKHKAWKILSRRGLKHREALFRDFPAIRETYVQAVWDSHTSLAAKMKGMTTSELLRLRLEP